jgi:DNA-binding MarR family transcriptional regulator
MSKKSIEAFREAAQSGLIKTTEQRIYVALYENGPMNLQELRKDARTCNIKHQTLTAVLSTMQDEGWIYQQDESGKWRIVWTLDEQAMAIEQRRKARFIKWWSVGLRENFFEDYNRIVRDALSAQDQADKNQ